MRHTLHHNLRCSMLDGACYMVCVGLAETFFPLFILELFGDRVASGLVATLPLLLACVLQIGAPAWAARAGAYKPVIVACAATQALACVLLAIVAFTGSASQGLLFLLATLYHAGAIVGASPWVSLMALILPLPIRAGFYARRTLVLQVSAVVAVLLGAALLERAPRIAALGQSPTLCAFAVLFVLAGLARCASAWFLWRHREPAHGFARGGVALRDAPRAMRSHGRLRLVGGIALFWCASMVASPFWPAFAKDVAGLSFMQWASAIAVWYVGKAGASMVVQRVKTRHDRRALMLWGAALMVPVPALWACSTHAWWLIGAQFFAGASIAVWEVAVWLATLEAFDDRERTTLLMLYDLLVRAGSLVGSLLGGLVLSALGQNTRAFMAIFIASAALRGVMFLVLTRTHRSGLPLAGRTFSDT